MSTNPSDWKGLLNGSVLFFISDGLSLKPCPPSSMFVPATLELYRIAYPSVVRANKRNIRLFV